MALALRPQADRPKDLDIQDYTDPENDPMIPHTPVLKLGLVIHSIYELRPEWYLSTPGLRQAWDAGDVSPAHGWDKRPAATESAA